MATPEFAEYDPYGRIRSAELVVRGWMQRVVLDTDKMKAGPVDKMFEFDHPLDGIQLDCKDEYMAQRRGKDREDVK